MLEKCHKLHPKPKTTDELKVVLQTNHLGKAATRTHQQGGGELHQVLLRLSAYNGCGCQCWSL